MAVDLIVTPRSCSSGRVSVKRASPAFAAEIIPARWTSESVRVDLPWSTGGICQRYLDVEKTSRLTVRNDRHVSDIGSLVHEFTDLIMAVSTAVLLLRVCASSTYFFDGKAVRKCMLATVSQRHEQSAAAKTMALPAASSEFDMTYLTIFAVVSTSFRCGCSVLSRASAPPQRLNRVEERGKTACG
jgi:hypothetical protein